MKGNFPFWYRSEGGKEKPTSGEFSRKGLPEGSKESKGALVYAVTAERGEAEERIMSAPHSL